MNIEIGEHARGNMNRMHVDEKRVRLILDEPDVDYPEGDGRRVAQRGKQSVVYVIEDGTTHVVTVLKRTDSQWTRRRRP